MKKTMSILLVVAMMSNTAFSASAKQQPQINHEKIAKTFDHFRYRMTVDLNPTDSESKSSAIADFKNQIAQLQNEGVSAQEIMDYTRNTVLDSASRADFDRLLGAMDVNHISSEEAGNMAMQFMAGKYQQGASYSGGARVSMKSVAIILGIVAMGVATYFLVKYLKERNSDDPPADPTITVTNTTTNTETVTTYETINGTETITHIETVLTTETVTDVKTLITTITETDTNTITDVPGLCCNAVTGQIVNASYNGCIHGDALIWVLGEADCSKLGPSSGWED